MANHILTLALLATTLVAAETAIPVVHMTCEKAVVTLRPCMGYLKGQGLKPMPPCCAAVHNLNAQCALTPFDRMQACICLRDIAPRFNVEPDRAKHLPALCKVNLGFSMALDARCNIPLPPPLMT